MKIVIAPDKFKGSLSSIQVAKSIATGISKVDSLKTDEKLEIIIIPMADGGEGSLEIIAGENANFQTIDSFDALMRPLKALYATPIINGQSTAVIESAATIGLFRLSNKERNPLKTTSYGLGLMILDAIHREVKNIIITVGGTATNDCGLGILAALGGLFFDNNGVNINIPTGADMQAVASMDLSQVKKLTSQCDIKILCDVTNPLLGEYGAAIVFSPQKGANEQMIDLLEQGARHITKMTNHTLNKKPFDLQGDGAGGGIAWALRMFCGAEIKSGSEFIAQCVNLEENISQADLIITGEGKFDSQSLHGKVVGYVAEIARKHKIPTIIMCGINDYITLDNEIVNTGISHIFSLTNRVSIKCAMHNAYEELASMAFDIFSNNIYIKR